jgi:threonine dehydrogenase-like Zn-dependent dehydrogenase
MRALVLNGEGGYAVEERPAPEPDAGEVLFRTHCSGICGADLHALQFGRYEDGTAIKILVQPSE